jgi:DNA-binding XRE family transcriptional regulator
MSVRTKKRPTDAQCTLTVTGPMAHAATALMALGALGFVETESQDGVLTGGESSESVHWRAAFPPLSDDERPGRMLRAARTKEALSQTQLASRTGIPQPHISEMEHGKRAIGKERAKKLADALQIDYHVFL